MKSAFLKWIPAVFSLALFASAGTMPQDNWSYYGKKLAVPDAAKKKGIAVTSSAIYVGVNVSGATTSIQKHASDGAYLSTFPTTFANVAGMVCDAAGNLYIFDFGAASLKAFDSSGTLLWATGSVGTGQGQFSNTSAPNLHGLLAVDQDDKLYVLDRGNNRVQIFNSNGTFQSMWGIAGTAAGQINNPVAIAARNGNVFILDYPGPTSMRVQSFTISGGYSYGVTRSGAPPSTTARYDRFAITPDGLLAVNGGASAFPSSLLDTTLQTVATLTLPSELAGTSPSNNRFGGAFTASGDLWTISEANVLLIERRYSATENPLTRSSLPLPEVISVAQRQASTLLDIDFRINDVDSATVEVAALGFVNGGDSLTDILRLATLVEGTDVNIGPGKPTNVTKRLTWNAAADWSSSFGELQVEILAKDHRDLLGTHWITVPSNGGVPAFQASAKPVEDADLLSIWYWLIAKGDPDITLINGEVKGVNGIYAEQTLASGTTTTEIGRTFLLARLGLATISTGQLSSLQSGNYGFSSSSTNTVVKP